MHYKQQDNYRTGYRVTLWKDGEPKDFLVCRLVATTFLEDLIDTDMTVNHIDGNRLNNNINNLEWVTRAENIRDGFDKNLYSNQRNCRLIDKDNKDYDFLSLSKASKFLGRGYSYLSGCLKFNRKIIDIKGNEYKIILF